MIALWIWLALFAGALIGYAAAALMVAAKDDRDEYAQAVEELARALREAYAYIHVMGEWDDFESQGFTIKAPEATAVADGERRAARAARAQARFGTVRRRRAARAQARFGTVPPPDGQTRVGIDRPGRKGGLR